jgi:hypothetical protein
VTSIPEALRALNRARVRYLLIGGYASVLHGVPRTTLDLDLALHPDPANVRRALTALGRLGLHAETDRVDENLPQGGVTVTNDQSVDLLTSVRGPPFWQLWRRRITVRIPGARIPVVSRRDKVRLLHAAGRAKDLEDARALESLEDD